MVFFYFGEGIEMSDRLFLKTVDNLGRLTVNYKGCYFKKLLWQF